MHDLKCGEKHADKYQLAITTSEGMTLFYLRSVVAAMRIFVKIFFHFAIQRKLMLASFLLIFIGRSRI